MPETCDAFDQWLVYFNSIAHAGAPSTTKNMLCSATLTGMAGYLAGHDIYYSPPAELAGATLGAVCAKTCEYGACPPSPPTPPPAAPPPPAACGSPEDIDASAIRDTSPAANLRDRRLQVGGARGIDRDRLHVLAPAIGMCGHTCIAAYEFAMQTGIRVKVVRVPICIISSYPLPSLL